MSYLVPVSTVVAESQARHASKTLRVAYFNAKEDDPNEIGDRIERIRRAFSAHHNPVAVASGSALVTKFWTGDWDAWARDMAEGVLADGPRLHIGIAGSPTVGRATGEVLRRMLDAGRYALLMTDRGFYRVEGVRPGATKWHATLKLAGADAALFLP